MFEAMGAPSSLQQAIEARTIEIYPENLQAFTAFGDLITQWRSGMNGREGLIYSEAYAWMDEQGIGKAAKRKDLMWALREMEGELLNALKDRQG